MADDDDYQILPQRDFFQLKKKVDELSGEASPKKLMETMDELKKILNELIELFKATSQEIKQEEKDDVAISKKLDKLMSQNKVMAEALLAISEKIGMHQETQERSQAEQPQPPPQAQQAPFMQQPPPQQQMPPPPLPGMQPYAQPEPFTPRPFGGFGQPDTRQFGTQPRQAPFEPPEFAPISGQNLGQFPQPTGPQPDFPDIMDPLGDKQKKKKGFFGFGK
jgi:hypothetical protein